MMIEVLSRVLNRPLQSFQFHHRCEKFRLIHLTFTDDLIIFYAADDSFLRFVCETLLKFWELSGLVANLGKSSMFVQGLIVRLLLCWLIV